MTDAQRFREFLDRLPEVLKLLPSFVTDLEIGFAAGPESAWMIYGADAYANIPRDAPHYRLGNGDVQIRHVHNNPTIRIMVGRVTVDIVPYRR